jgi:Fe-S-cluster-containing dehydrogenase component
MKNINRKDFLKYGVGVAGLLALGKYAIPSIAQAHGAGSNVPSATEAAAVIASAGPRKDGEGTQPVKGAHFGMVIDVGGCIGCRTCTWGCKQENNTPDNISPLWIENFELKLKDGGEPEPEDLNNGATTSYTESPTPGHWYMPVACNHCDNAPCVKVCPTGATAKEPDGYVSIDYNKCIGCRLCVVACPYNARRFNWFKPDPVANPNPLVPLRPVGVVEKCTFCIHRTRRGKLPRCVEVCPIHARHFGDFNDPNSEVSNLIASNVGFHLLTELNTKPNLWYITRGTKWYSK